jgi:hypothetical protein
MKVMDTLGAAPIASGDFAADVAAFAAYWRGAGTQAARDARWAFLRRHARTLYEARRPRATPAGPSCAVTRARSMTS